VILTMSTPESTALVDDTSRTDRHGLIVMGAVTLTLLALGWGVFAAVALTHRDDLGADGVLGIGLAATAFLLGVRHAFDPDHVAAIDNTTRKLVSDGRPSLTVGFWFALGHSTVVVTTVVLLTTGLGAFTAQFAREDSPLHAVTAVWGPAVAGVFLLVIGLLNVEPFLALLRMRRDGRLGDDDAPAIDAALSRRGLLARALAPVARRVDRPWKMYPVGLLFGLGFDTASTIALLVIGANAVATVPWYVVLAIPVLFTAGMVTFDAANGAAMNGAYRWAHRRPRRRLGYNLIVTGLSVAVAFAVGLLSLSAAVAEVSGADYGPLGALGAVDLGDAGFVLVALFGVIWAVAFAWSRARARRLRTRSAG
jgi:high-affinity nickel-transport protein